MIIRKWLTLLLPVLLLPALLLPMSVRADVSDLKVLTHNVFFPVFGWGLGEGPGNAQRAALIKQADYIRGYDVVVLNELFEVAYDGSGPANIVLDGLYSQYPYQTPIIASNLNDHLWDQTIGSIDSVKKNGGVAILSQWPIEEQIQVMYGTSCGDDSLDNKGFVYARINRHNERIHVIGTHTQSESSNCGGEPKGADVRTAQLQKIAAFIDSKNIPEDEVVIIAGDLNIKRGGPEYSGMLSTLKAADPLYHNTTESWNPAQNDLAAKQYPGYQPEHLDYVLLEAGHKQIPGWGNATLVPSSGANNTWQDTVNIPNFFHYESDEFSDHFPVVGYAATVADAPDLTPRKESYKKIRLKSVSSGGYVSLSNESDGWLMADQTSPSWRTEFEIETWGLDYADTYCLATNNYKSINGWPGVFVKLKSKHNGRYMKYWRGGDGDYGYYAASEPSDKLYIRKTGPTTDGCIQNGDRVVFGDFGGVFWYYVTVWPSGSWKNAMFLWDRGYDSDNEFIIEVVE